MDHVTLAEALDLVFLYAEAEPAKYERAALRWHARYVSETAPSLLDTQIALAALSDLRSGSDRAGSILMELAAGRSA
jgi:hypothetical protein